jgi:hypothetical protein
MVKWYNFYLPSRNYQFDSDYSYKKEKFILIIKIDNN